MAMTGSSLDRSRRTWPKAKEIRAAAGSKLAHAFSPPGPVSPQAAPAPTREWGPEIPLTPPSPEKRASVIRAPNSARLPFDEVKEEQLGPLQIMSNNTWRHVVGTRAHHIAHHLRTNGRMVCGWRYKASQVTTFSSEADWAREYQNHRAYWVCWKRYTVPTSWSMPPPSNKLGALIDATDETGNPKEIKAADEISNQEEELPDDSDDSLSAAETDTDADADAATIDQPATAASSARTVE